MDSGAKSPGSHPTADLGVYVLEALPSPESTRLRQHLETCPDCRRRVDELEGLSELIAAARLVPEPPPGLAEMVLATLPPQTAGAADPWANPDHGDAGLLTTPEPKPRPPLGQAQSPGVRPALWGRRDTTAAGPLGDGDFVLTPDEDRVRIDVARNGAVAMGAAAVLIVALIVAGLVFVLAPERTPAGETVTLLPTGNSDASGTARLNQDEAGTALHLRVEGLAAGDYVVTVAASTTGDAMPAGGFFSDGGVVEADLHTSATSGDVLVSQVQDPGEAVLSGRFG